MRAMRRAAHRRSVSRTSGCSRRTWRTSKWGLRRRREGHRYSRKSLTRSTVTSPRRVSPFKWRSNQIVWIHRKRSQGRFMDSRPCSVLTSAVSMPSQSPFKSRNRSQILVMKTRMSIWSFLGTPPKETGEAQRSSRCRWSTSGRKRSQSLCSRWTRRFLHRASSSLRAWGHRFRRKWATTAETALTRVPVAARCLSRTARLAHSIRVLRSLRRNHHSLARQRSRKWSYWWGRHSNKGGMIGCCLKIRNKSSSWRACLIAIRIMPWICSRTRTWGRESFRLK